jgi:energy-coupling factor transporter ATP-binding protein EcfA2
MGSLDCDPLVVKVIGPCGAGKSTLIKHMQLVAGRAPDSNFPQQRDAMLAFLASREDDYGGNRAYLASRTPHPNLSQDFLHLTYPTLGQELRTVGNLDVWELSGAPPMQRHMPRFLCAPEPDILLLVWDSEVPANLAYWTGLCENKKALMVLTGEPPPDCAMPQMAVPRFCEPSTRALLEVLHNL